MQYAAEEHYTFTSKALPADTFGVTVFQGAESLSECYEFDITLVTTQRDIDLDEVLRHPVTFTIKRRGGDIPFHGILARFEQHQAYKEYVFYRALLVPKLWWLTQIRHNQIFLDQTVPQSIEAVFKDAGLTTLDYELRLHGQYDRRWEFVCQYRESHFHFLSRWLEREGMYFFFEQGQDAEKVIISDTKIVHVGMPQGKTLTYAPQSGLDQQHSAEVIHSVICRQNRLPQQLILKDYNYRHPSLDLTVQADVSPNGLGDLHIYGEHYQTPAEGEHLAQIRTEEMRCRQKQFVGESAVSYLRPGYIFTLEDHYREDFNTQYLTTQVQHQGSQAAYLTAGLKDLLSAREQDPLYQNTFTAIPADVQFRPDRKTEKPRFYGTINAHIDAAGAGDYAELDDWGRYKVILPFDLSGRKDGKASAWLRMAQPYAGDNHGLHFPQHKGTEVLLTFIDGDPDRPVIAAAVPNPQHNSVVSAANPTKAGFQTAGGNTIHMEDHKGNQHIVMKTGQSNSVMKMGCASPTTEFYLGSDFVNHSANLVSTDIAGFSKNIGSLASHTTLTGSVWFQALKKTISHLIESTPDLATKAAELAVKADSEQKKEDVDGDSSKTDKEKDSQKAGIDKKTELDTGITKMVASIGGPLYDKIVNLIVDKVLLNFFFDKLGLGETWEDWHKSAVPETPDEFKKCGFSVIHKDGTTLVQQKSNYSGNLWKGALRPLGVKLEPTKGMFFFEGEGAQTFQAKEAQKFFAEDLFLARARQIILRSPRGRSGFINLYSGKNINLRAKKAVLSQAHGAILLQTGSGMVAVPNSGIHLLADNNDNIEIKQKDGNVNGSINIQSNKSVKLSKDKDHIELKKHGLANAAEIKVGNNFIQVFNSDIGIFINNKRVVRIYDGGVHIKGDLSMQGDLDVTGKITATGTVTSSNVKEEG